MNDNTQTSRISLIALLILIAAFVFVLYRSIKLVINFKNSIIKTKEVLGQELITKYVQGLRVKSNAFYNILFTEFLWLIVIIISAILIARVPSGDNSQQSSLSTLYAIIGLSLVGLIATNLAILYLYLTGFNSTQYKHSQKNLESELVSMKYTKEIKDETFPDEIRIDVAKINKANPLVPKVLANFILAYNKKIGNQKIPLQKRYFEYLNQIFKIRFFNESLDFIEQQQAQEHKILGFVGDNSTTSIANMSPIQKEIAWMEKMDKKVKLIKETSRLEQMDKKEFAKKYDEYLYTVRSQDPAYQQIQKNNWLTYRDSDIEDLFYNPNTPITYSLDLGNSSNEKNLVDFLNEYKNYLEAKFFSNL
ncbi:hypothetical protein DA803_02335 [[Mycoplasma] phocae]|uniref:Uncharacterized protein n=1 Tax=[Mycoplasma] phocae TaxID=142651 RepID=A0A2Z5IQG8_9BACT|nr:hypothetical protein [[Mycoplasma] phocae]AXE60920.1 hypothetical protein DA803_02335 [[Mycoplasma] phocae]